MKAQAVSGVYLEVSAVQIDLLVSLSSKYVLTADVSLRFGPYRNDSEYFPHFSVDK
jgi:hypothetical protein